MSITREREMQQAKTSFGRIMSDGHVAICDTNPPVESDAPDNYGSARAALAEKLWVMAVESSIQWPDLSALNIKPCTHKDGSIRCDECNGSGEAECPRCLHESVCEECGGDGRVECDCLAGVGVTGQSRVSAISLGFHVDAEGNPVGANPLYLEAARLAIGPVAAMWFGEIGQKSKAFIIVGERGRAIVMPYRMPR